MKSSLITVGAIVLLGSAFYFGGCNYKNVNVIKANATNTLQQAGYTVTGYEGYQIGSISTPGGRVWYSFERNEILYDGFVSKWGNEYHIYNITPLNAVNQVNK